jgi:hypothetical protein
VQEYGRYYEEDSQNMRGTVRPVTQSATNLAVVEELAGAIGRLAGVLHQLLAEKDIYVENAISRTQRFVVRFKILRAV